MARLTKAELAAGVALLRPKPPRARSDAEAAASVQKSLATRQANAAARLAAAEHERATAMVLADAERATAAEASARRGRDDLSEALRRDLLAGRFR
jgi:hypothetical protein